METGKRILMALCLMALITLNVCAVDVDEIKVDVDDTSIYTGQRFVVEINLENPDDTDTAEVDLEIYFNDILVHRDENVDIDLVDGVDKQILVDSLDFFVENHEDYDDEDVNVWKDRLMAFECIDDANIEVVLSGDIDGSDSVDITIENKKNYDWSFRLNPESFGLTDKFVLEVWDEDADEEFSGKAKARLTYLDTADGMNMGEWDPDDDVSSEETTDSDGEADFKISTDIRDEDWGKYLLEIWKENYCKMSQVLDLANGLNVTGPEPANPKIGENFKIKVLTRAGKPATGLFAYLSPGNIQARVMTDGYATFTVPSDGSFTIAVGGSLTDYDEVFIPLTIAKLDVLSPSIEPSKPKVNEKSVITVKAGGNPITGASITVRREGEVEQTLPGLTSSDGTILFTPIKVGDYTIKASKANYESGSITTEIKNSFVIKMPDSSLLKRGQKVAIEVRDATGLPVAGAQVSISGTSILGTTNSMGVFEFTVEEAGNFDVLVKKDGFDEVIQSLSAKGSLQIKTSTKEVNIGETVKITVTDAQGVPIEASIKVSGPSSGSKSGSVYDFEPSKAGKYTVTAEKSAYEGTTESFNVRPKPVTIAYSFNEGRLLLNASTNDNPVSDLEILVEHNGQTLSTSTDDKGMASVAVNESGKYTIKIDVADYEKTSVDVDYTGEANVSSYILPAIIVITVLIVLAIFAVVLIGLIQRSSKKGKAQFDKKGGSRLDR